MDNRRKKINDMSRINRLKWNASEYGIFSYSEITDVFDNFFKSSFRITDDEYDYICEHATYEELEALIPKINYKPSFSEKRNIIKILNKYIYV